MLVILHTTTDHESWAYASFLSQDTLEWLLAFSHLYELLAATHYLQSIFKTISTTVTVTSLYFVSFILVTRLNVVI